LIPTLMGGGKLFFVGTLISNYFLLDQNLAVGAAFTTLSGVVLSGALLIAFLMFEYVYYKTTRAQ